MTVHEKQAACKHLQAAFYGLCRFIKGIKTGDIALRLGDDEL